MIRFYVAIHCDGEDGKGCPQWWRGVVFRPTASEATLIRKVRKMARRHSWGRVRGPRRSWLDLCPICMQVRRIDRLHAEGRNPWGEPYPPAVTAVAKLEGGGR